MANFTPSKKTAQDFNNGIEYIDGIGDIEGDAVQAETINNLVESALYSQEQAETAVETANNALEQISEIVESSFSENGNYPNLTSGKAIADGSGNNISETYVKISDFDRLILEKEYPVGGKPYIQYEGMQTPAQRWANTSWEIDTAYAGRTFVGSGAGFTLGATGGEETHTMTQNELAQHSHSLKYANFGGTGAFKGTYMRFLDNDSLLFVGNDKSAVNEIGNSKPFNIMQPYKVVAVWKRLS